MEGLRCITSTTRRTKSKTEMSRRALGRRDGTRRQMRRKYKRKHRLRSCGIHQTPRQTSEKHTTPHTGHSDLDAPYASRPGAEKIHTTKRLRRRWRTEFQQISFDYAYIGTEGEEGGRTLIIGVGKWTKNHFAHCVECKGCSDPNVVKKVIKSIDEPGNIKAILKGDGEPALVQVQDAIKQTKSHEAVVQNPPVYLLHGKFRG